MKKFMIVTLSIVAGLVVISAIYVLPAPTSRYLSIQRYHHLGDKLDFESYGFLVRDHLRRLKQEYHAAPTPENSKALEFHITVTRENLSKLNQKLPQSGLQFVDVTIGSKTTKNEFPALIKYRGGMIKHWLWDKKSLSVKTKSILPGLKTKQFILLNPHNPAFIVSYCEYYNLSRKLGLIAPKCHPARVFLNKNYTGVYLYFEQINEELAKRVTSSSGAILSGDHFAEESIDRFSTGESKLWRHSHLWKLEGNKENTKMRLELKDLLDSIRSSDKRFYSFFNAKAEKNRIYTYMALDILFSIWHHGYAHNHKIFFSDSGRFQFISWDPLYMGDFQESFRDAAYYPLLDKLYKNPILQFELDKEILRLSKVVDISSFSANLIAKTKHLAADFAADPYLDSYLFETVPELKGVFVLTPVKAEFVQNEIARIASNIEKRWKYVSDLIVSSNILVMISPGNSGKTILEINVAGQNGVLLEIAKLVKLKSSTWKKTSIKKIAPVFSDKIKNAYVNYTNDLILLPGRRRVKLDGGFKTFTSGSSRREPAFISYRFEIDSKELELNENYQFPSNLDRSKKIKFTIGKPKHQFKSDSIHPWSL